LSRLASFKPFLTWLGLAQLEKLEPARKLARLMQSFSFNQYYRDSISPAIQYRAKC
jgi:hypothetical protein